MPPRDFAPPRELKYDEQERRKIARYVRDVYDDRVMARQRYNDKHERYEDMFRGKHNLDRGGPWIGAANIHVPAPYWLVDSINTRIVNGIFGQKPLVSCKWTDKSDEPRALKAAHNVEWNFGRRRMNLRNNYARSSKIRLVHGVSAAIVSYAKVYHQYRVPGEAEQIPITDNDGNPVLDENGMMKTRTVTKPKLADEPKYIGPVISPLEYDDVLPPLGCMNLQPLDESNPGGAHSVIIRQRERLSVMMEKAENGAYPFMMEEGDEAWWRAHAPSQDYTTSSRTGGNNNRRARRDATQTGIQPIPQRDTGREGGGGESDDQDVYKNPEFEILIHFVPWKDEESGKYQEMIFFSCLEPEVFLGGVYLVDYYFKGQRPIPEWHYQTVGTKWYSMGVMEIVERMSEELDTIHNLRLDVGFATNLPFFFYRASSGFNPNKIELKPWKGIPVQDPNDFTFPQFGNMTTFYHQEETLLFTLIERTMGVADLFLGVNPTRGAASRHATGFVGTQQEAEARLSEVMAQDAGTFAFICDLVHNMEIQYGPDYRDIRMHGEGDEVIEYNKLSREEIRMIGEYDFELGANHGSFSNSVRQQQAQAILNVVRSSPLAQYDMGRIWEGEAEYIRSIGKDPEKFIGRKEDIAVPTPKEQDEENQDMTQYQFGVGNPAPVHPSDNDQLHLQKIYAYLQSDAYNSMDRPNEAAFLQHASQHQQQLQAKQMQQQMAIQAQQGQPNEQVGPVNPGADAMQRAGAQINNVTTMPMAQEGQGGKSGGGQNFGGR